MNISVYSTPLTQERCAEYEAFLRSAGLRDEGDSDIIAWMTDDSGKLAACGSLAGHTLKQFAVDPSIEGSGAMAQIMTRLIEEAYNAGNTRLFLCTKPKNTRMLSSMGFFPLVIIEDAVLMENRRNGLEKFLKKVKADSSAAINSLSGIRDNAFKAVEEPPCRMVSDDATAMSGRTVSNEMTDPEARLRCTPEQKDSCVQFAGGQPVFGAVVCNCDPFTLGHRHLIEYAAENCDFLYVFAVSEAGSMFTPEERLEMIKAGTADIPDCRVYSSELYLVSRATFPAYFIRDEEHADEVRSDLDIALFSQRIAPVLGITRRFVGAEPFSPTTRAYNERMKELLPQSGIELIEIPRLEFSPVTAEEDVEGSDFLTDSGSGDAISASRVRRLIADGRLEEARPLVPDTTFEIIRSIYGSQ